MKNIGIVCEGPTDYIILRGVIDKITHEDNHYVQLQPEPDLTGEYGNGWRIAKKKYYHDIRISGNKKRARIYVQFVNKVCENWNQVAKLCLSAREFERNLSLLIADD